MTDNQEEKRPTRNVVIKLRFRKAEASIQKCKRKIARLNNIIAMLNQEMERRQSSENHLLNDLAEDTDYQIKNYDIKKGTLNARIISKGERKAYLLELDRLSVRDRFTVYFSHLSDFIYCYNFQLALVFLCVGAASAVSWVATEFISIPLLVLTIVFPTIAFFLFLL